MSEATAHESVSGRRYIAIYRDRGWHVCDTKTQRVSRTTTPDLSICLLACEHHEAGHHHIAADLMRPVRSRMEVIEDPLRIRQIFEEDQRREDELEIKGDAA